ncbi:DUF433 domain-containing protein [Kovacikia minuta CCNUW1]|uniref:DUF433 domain-containing protein n=1 Tax=Kovacikia minuta TaxID=2931930 RepID=UPI001CC90FCD|nr:DUF433 domain-containing protein [Kovacikia minuta]UBF24249.1 DUF433 domain-containing protein [Kovacikia minuta CCNUW1]
MNLAITTTEPNPLSINSDGVILVGGTRVTLRTVISVFKKGATAEEIVSRFPSLDLADVYVVIAYYLRHQDEVEAYLQEQEEISEQIRAENERRFPSKGLRDRLLARRQAERESALANQSGEE